MPLAPRTRELQINNNETIEVHDQDSHNFFSLLHSSTTWGYYVGLCLKHKNLSKDNRWKLIVYLYFLPVLVMVEVLGHERAVTWLLNSPTLHIQCVPVIILLTLLFSWGQENSR